MSRGDFRDFIRKGFLRSISKNGQICHTGNNFSGLFYIALINPKYKVSYIKHGQKYASVSENSWIGIIEFMLFKKEMLAKEKDKTMNKKADTWKKLKTKVKWGLDAVVEEITEEEKSQLKVDKDPIYDEEDDPCYVFEFPLDVLFILNFRCSSNFSMIKVKDLLGKMPYMQIGSTTPLKLS